MNDTIDLNDDRALRDVLGRFGSGVCVVTGRNSDGETVGMTCQSFMGVSLDPPLVLISVMRTSRTLRHLKAHGHFAVSVLGEEDESVSATAGSKAPDKFDRVPLDTTRTGQRIVRDAHAWFACALYTTVEAGDHELLLGQVLEAGPRRSARSPLLFHGGRYASLVSERVLSEPANMSNLLTAVGPGTWF